jgi:hypothetical protein
MVADWSWIVAAGLPTAVTASLLIARWSIRRHRSAVINELTARLSPEGAASLPQLDFVRAKYTPGAPRGAGQVPGAERHSLGALLVTATLFTLVAVGAAALLILPQSRLLGAEASHILLWIAPGDGPDALAQAITVSGFAALGAYFAMLAYLQKAVINYELDALSFARATLMTLLGAAVATVLHRAVPTLPFGPDVGRTGWAGLAFLLGLAHESGLTFVIRKFDFRYRKAVADLNGSEIVTVEIIQGIDSDIAFRLQESNIYDVQNLATANPIQLCVETPFGLYESFDWVLQAQLCLAVGRTIYLKLRSQYGVRTAFDLERAALSCGAPDEYVRALGTVLFSEADPTFTTRLKLNGAGPSDVEMIRHAVAVLIDDLHVHRLRKVWRQIQGSVGEKDADWLYHVRPLPGDRMYPACDCPSEAARGVANAA